MYILSIVSVIKKMLVNELRDFIFENHYKRIGFVKKKFLFNETFEQMRFFIDCN